MNDRRRGGWTCDTSKGIVVCLLLFPAKPHSVTSFGRQLVDFSQLPELHPNDVCAKRPGRLKFVYQIVYQNACLVVDVKNLARRRFNYYHLLCSFKFTQVDKK